MNQTDRPNRPRRGRPRPTKSAARTKRAYNLIVNLCECWGDLDLVQKLAKRLTGRLERAGWQCNLETVEDWDEYDKQVVSSIRKRPYAIVVFGGDGSVRTAAARAYRANRLLGIIPCGQYNNIFHSLYGHTDPEIALEIISKGYQTRIDAGIANGTFFLGSLITGVVPGMMAQVGEKKLPRMTMSWTKMAGKAADETMPRSSVIKVDTFTIETQPLMLHVHLLPKLMTLNFAPVAACNDGRVVALYDNNGTRDTIAHYIRDLKKGSYQYNDTIHMIRGHRLSISPAEGRIWLLDSEPVEFTGQEIMVEVVHQALRVFANSPAEKHEK